MEPYTQNVRIKCWAEEDRPREKLLIQGRRALSDAELIAILIGSGSRNETAVELSRRILHAMNNSLNKLATLTVKDLEQFKGIGEAKALSIVAALEIGRRRKDEQACEKSKINSSLDSYKQLESYFSDLNHEEFWVILLNRANRVLGKALISKGGQAGTLSDPKIIFKVALDYRAAGIVLSHNHPSGNLKPSHADIELTHRLVECGKMMEMPIIDHLIFGEREYFSFIDAGLM